MKQIIVFLGIICFLTPAFLSAQTASSGTAAELETLLETPVVNCTQAAKFVLGAAGNVTSTESVSNDAYQSAVSNGWLKNTEPDTHITLDKLSFLIMKAFEIKGGLMYTLFPSPRYAYRLMASRNFLQGIIDPSMTVSGDEFLIIMGRVLSAEGGE
jgi:hypothetical protein